MYTIYIIETTVAGVYETSSSLFNFYSAEIVCTGIETHLANCSRGGDGLENNICTNTDVEDAVGITCRIGK